MIWNDPLLCEHHYYIQSKNALINQFFKINQSSTEYEKYGERKQIEEEIEEAAKNIAQDMRVKIFSSQPPLTKAQEEEHFNTLLEQQYDIEE